MSALPGIKERSTRPSFITGCFSSSRRLWHLSLIPNLNRGVAKILSASEAGFEAKSPVIRRLLKKTTRKLEATRRYWLQCTMFSFSVVVSMVIFQPQAWESESPAKEKCSSGVSARNSWGNSLKFQEPRRAS